MADLTITARNVRALPASSPGDDYAAGGSGNIGDLVYVDSDSKVQQASAAAAGTAEAIGVVISAGGEGKTAFVSGDVVHVKYLTRVNGFSSLTPGTKVFLSDTAGKFADAAGTVSKRLGVVVTADAVLLERGMAA